MYLKGFLKLSLSHHPVCWQYRDHVLRFKSWSFCLGCSGFYSGLIFGGILILVGIINYSWTELVSLSLLFSLPTVLRILSTSIFTTNRKELRFSYRFLLGFGIAIGLLSIWVAGDLLIQIIQIILGVGLYIGLTLEKLFNKTNWQECETCTFVRNPKCPGFNPFYSPYPADIMLMESPPAIARVDINQSLD